MTSYKVTSPVAGFNGTRSGVTFVDGTATVDDEAHPAQLAYFRAQGYDVTEPAGEPDIDALRADAAGLGVKVDSRWGAKRLQAEIDAALASDKTTDSAGSEPAGDEENQQ